MDVDVVVLLAFSEIALPIPNMSEIDTSERILRRSHQPEDGLDPTDFSFFIK